MFLLIFYTLWHRIVILQVCVSDEATNLGNLYIHTYIQTHVCGVVDGYGFLVLGRLGVIGGKGENWWVGDGEMEQKIMTNREQETKKITNKIKTQENAILYVQYRSSFIASY